MDERERFVEKLAAALAREDLDGTIDGGADRLTLPSGVTVELDHVFAEWERSSRFRRGGLLRQFVAALVEPGALPESAEEAGPNILLRVRDLEWYSIMALRSGDAGSTPAHRPLNDQLALELVYDLPARVAAIPTASLELWGLSLDEAIEVARANLADRTEGTFASLADGVFGSTWQDGYGAARVVLTDLVCELEVAGDPVAFLPHRDHLFITGSDDEGGLTHAAALAGPLFEEAGSVTGRAAVWRGGRWQPFLPPAGHPAREPLVRLARLTEARSCREQTRALHAETDAGVVVDDLILAGDPATGVVRSICRWAEGVVSLLPRADQIAFVSSVRVMRVAWEDAVTIMGEAMVPRGMVPERWLVERFPDADELAALAAHEISV